MSRPPAPATCHELTRRKLSGYVSGFYNIELFAPLRPQSEWRRGVTKESMTAELSRALQESFPGVIFNFSQMISDNVEEAMSGVKGENTVKVVGPDLNVNVNVNVNEKKANEIVDVMSGIKGVEDLGLFPSLGQPNVRITPDREQCGRYGLNVGDVDAVIQAAIGGQAVTQVYEGERRFDLTVRWAPPFRRDLRSIRSILVSTPDGSQIPLGQLAQIAEEEGPRSSTGRTTVDMHRSSSRCAADTWRPRSPRRSGSRWRSSSLAGL